MFIELHMRLAVYAVDACGALILATCNDCSCIWLLSQTNDPEKVKKGKEGKLKDSDGRTAVMQANGIMHNGIDDDKVYK